VDCTLVICSQIWAKRIALTSLISEKGEIYPSLFTNLNESPVIGAISSGSISSLTFVPLSLETSPLSSNRAPLLKPTDNRVRLSLTLMEVGMDEPRPLKLSRVVRMREGLPFLSGLS
jgi:hypothetical protein